MKRTTALLSALAIATLQALAPSAALAAPGFTAGEEREGLKFPNDSLEVADLDRDGVEDAISVGYYDGPCACGEVRITYGGSDGLTDRIQRFYPDWAGDLELADFNRDGRLDLAVAKVLPSGESSGIALYLSRRSGKYVERVDDTAVTGAMTTADFDRDGRADLAVQKGHRIQVLFGSGHGRFSDGPSVRTTGDVMDVLATDLDRDGLHDLVTRSSAGIEVFEGRKRGRLSAGQLTEVALGEGGGEMVAGDLERDGDRDLVVPNGGRLTALVNNGGGALSPGAVLESDRPDYVRVSDVELADVDGNGSRDLLVAYTHAASGIELWSGDGAGGFALDSELPATDRATGLATTDFNADGKLDLAVQREDVREADGPTQLTSLLQTAGG